MKLLLALLLFIPAICRADAFADGNQAYASGKYEQAAASYRNALAEGEHANIWFNCGNAFYRLDKLGEAALAYERALLAQPNHPEAAANLKFTREKAHARIAEAPWLEKAWRYVAQPLSSWLLVGEAWLGFALIGGTLLGRRSRASLVLGVILVVLGAGGIGALHYARQELAKVAITLDGSDARVEPADRAGLAETLGPGSRVQVISVQGDWTYCVLPSGGRGWIPSKAIERIVAAGRL
jgi:tetratricopeptide (TPR) repeat protein